MTTRKARPQSLLSAQVLLLALAQAGYAADKVRVGSFEKPASGQLLDLEAGDVACYATLKDSRGYTSTEYAEFEICEHKDLIGAFVRLEYSVGNVLADECQGNPDCGKSQQVALISRLIPSTRAKAAPTSTLTRGFCDAQETLVYSCKIRDKQVSVCASDALSTQAGYLQYRFGKVAGGKLELELPATRGGAPFATVFGRHEQFNGVGGTWLRFSKKDYSYTVYRGVARWGPKRGAGEQAGVVVERLGGRVVVFRCTDKPSGALSAAWLEQFALPAREQAFEFPD